MEYKSSDQLLTDLKAGKYKQVYLLHGEEAFFIDEVSDYIEHHVLDETSQAFNLSVLYGRDVETRQVLDHARQFPMMATHRVVIVKEAKGMKDLAALDTYIQHPSDTTILVIAHKDKAIDGRIAWVKQAKKQNHVGVLKTEPIRDYNIEKWVAAYLSSQGLTITPDANRLLCQSLGTDLSKITNELEKVRLNLKGTKVDADIITRNVGVSKEFNVFELIAAIARRDAPRVQYIASQMEDNTKREPIVKLLPQIAAFIEKSLVASQHLSRDDRSLASIIGAHYMFVQDYKLAVRNYSESGLRRIYKYVIEAEGRVKGVEYRRGDQDVLKELVGKILLG